MSLIFRLSKDAALIANMNKPVQDLHYNLHPEYFKPFSYDETVLFLEKQLLEENWFCYIANLEGIDVGYALFLLGIIKRIHLEKNIEEYILIKSVLHLNIKEKE
jgi:diamine N-acetyltransferase